jgi:hypothetical protein
MVDVLKILVLLQQNARGPRQNKYDSNESGFLQIVVKRMKYIP